MKLLDGSELAGFIKERQAKQVRNLRQSWHVAPKLAIVQTIDNPVIDTYVRLKRSYGADILIDVELHKVSQAELISTIEQLNADTAVHGIIVQLPLADAADTERAVNMVAPQKDVDGLGEAATLTPATPLAIDWLLAGYNVALQGKKIALIGAGRLVGAPLERLWRAQGLDVTVFTRANGDMSEQLPAYDVIVTAAGAPGIVTPDMVKHGGVVVDAGTASEDGKIMGDVAPELRGRDDITITPEKGGVGPLTIAALFDNVIAAARATASETSA